MNILWKKSLAKITLKQETSKSFYTKIIRRTRFLILKVVQGYWRHVWEIFQSTHFVYFSHPHLKMGEQITVVRRKEM